MCPDDNHAHLFPVNHLINSVSFLVHINPCWQPGALLPFLELVLFFIIAAAPNLITLALSWNVESILVCFVRWRSIGKSNVIRFEINVVERAEDPSTPTHKLNPGRTRLGDLTWNGVGSKSLWPKFPEPGISLPGLAELIGRDVALAEVRYGPWRWCGLSRKLRRVYIWDLELHVVSGLVSSAAVQRVARQVIPFCLGVVGHKNQPFA